MTVSHPPAEPRSPTRTAVAVEALKLSNRLSRALGRGSGTVAGGRVGLAIDPRLLTGLAGDRRVALISGTNGKTTTTRLMVAALSDPDRPTVATNGSGANMPAGHVAALVDAPSAPVAVLEVDEGYLGRVVAETAPRVVVLLNLSRDQLDRISEVRMLAERWRTALGGLAGDPESDTVVVANADDPMVVYAAASAPRVRWVGVGQVWRNDAVGCPACGGRIVFGADHGWACDRCEFDRPACDDWLESAELVTRSGWRQEVDLRLPGQFNRGNAAMVAVAVAEMTDLAPGPDTPDHHRLMADALARMGTVDQVAGRFSTIERGGCRVRLLLAKNPAGWTAIFDLLDEPEAVTGPVVLSINARVADGFDTSWLWDVPFERLAGRAVVATGERRLDLAVRLRYAEVAHTVVADPLGAVDAAVMLAGASASDREEQPTADFLGNYTAFADLRARL